MTKTIKSLLLGTLCVSFGGCQVSKTQSAKIPKVEMHTTGGQLPAYNIQGPNVQVGEKTQTFQTPTVHVTTPHHQ